MMVPAGLCAQGPDPLTDREIKLCPKIDAFIGGQVAKSNANSFTRLRKALDG